MKLGWVALKRLYRETETRYRDPVGTTHFPGRY